MATKRLWSTDELAASWTLSPDDFVLARGHTDAGELGLMCQLAFWREHGRLPEVEADLAPTVVEHLARQLGVAVDLLQGYAFAVRSTRAAHDDEVLSLLAGRLDGSARDRLDALVADDGSGAPYTQVSADPGKVGLESLLAELGKLDAIRAVALPGDLLGGVHPDAAKRLRRRAGVETAWELRRHPARIRLPLLAAWSRSREAEIVDGLIELLIQVTHRITIKASAA